MEREAKQEQSKALQEVNATVLKIFLIIVIGYGLLELLHAYFCALF